MNIIAWRSHDPYQWVCQYQSAEGRVCWEKRKCLWYAHVTRPRHTGKSHCFVKLVEEVEWTEKEIVELANQPEVPEPAPQFLREEQIEADRARLWKKLFGIRFWTDPAAMEPKRITYTLFIELEAKPVSFKTLDLPWWAVPGKTASQ